MMDTQPIVNVICAASIGIDLMLLAVCLSVASNVTALRTELKRIATALEQHNKDWGEHEKGNEDARGSGQVPER